MEFGNGRDNDNILFTYGRYNKVFKPLCVNTIGHKNVLSFGSGDTELLNADCWNHLAFVLDFPKAYVYINGSLVGEGTSAQEPRNVTRYNNFIGRGNWPDLHEDANCLLDNVKVFNRALSMEEVSSEIYFNGDCPLDTD